MFSPVLENIETKNALPIVLLIQMRLVAVTGCFHNWNAHLLQSIILYVIIACITLMMFLGRLRRS